MARSSPTRPRSPRELRDRAGELRDRHPALSREFRDRQQPAGYRSVTVTATFTSPSGPAKPPIIRVFTSQAVIARLARLLDGMHATAPWTGGCPALLPQFQIVFAPKRNGNSMAGPVSVTPSGCRGELLTTEGMLQPALEDIGSTRLLAVIGPLLDVHRHYW